LRAASSDSAPLLVEDAFGGFSRSQLGEALGQVDLRLVIKIGPGHVDELGGLLLDGGDHGGVAVARGDHGDAGREIKEQVAIHVFNDGAAAALHHEGINARVRRRHVTLIALQKGRAPGARKRCLDPRHGAIIE